MRRKSVRKSVGRNVRRNVRKSVRKSSKRNVRKSVRRKNRTVSKIRRSRKSQNRTKKRTFRGGATESNTVILEEINGAKSSIEEAEWLVKVLGDPRVVCRRSTPCRSDVLQKHVKDGEKADKLIKKALKHLDNLNFHATNIMAPDNDVVYATAV